MVFNATFNNISVVSWQSVLFVEEAEGITLQIHVNGEWLNLWTEVNGLNPSRSFINMR